MSEEAPRILVVEDSVELAKLLALKLGQAGYAVHCESDGYQGLARARRDQADLLILDRDLPGLDGLEICRRVREALDVPILMLTSAGEVQDRRDREHRHHPGLHPRHAGRAVLVAHRGVRVHQVPTSGGLLLGAAHPTRVGGATGRAAGTSGPTPRASGHHGCGTGQLSIRMVEGTPPPRCTSSTSSWSAVILSTRPCTT